MSAYVLIEATVRDEAARARYAPLAQPSAKEFGGEVLVTGPWHTLFGDPAFATGMLIRFPDKKRPSPGITHPAIKLFLNCAPLRSTAASAFLDEGRLRNPMAITRSNWTW
jgi:uncharacterized protein (DUF1330 family)